MIYKNVNLKLEYPFLTKDLFLDIYCPDNYEEININRVRPSILIFPGGGYEITSRREAEPIALRFMGYDLNCFVLNYNVIPEKYPYPFLEGYVALDYIRKHAKEYHVDENKLGVMGFSAGAHFACSLACYSEDEEFVKLIGTNKTNLKVNFLVGCYPVVTTDPSYSHQGSITNCTKNDPKLLDKYSIEKHVTKDFPPTFLWHTKEDTCVPVKNTLELQKALNLNGVKNEVLIFEYGNHGASLADRMCYGESWCTDEQLNTLKPIREWVTKCIDFIRSL